MSELNTQRRPDDLNTQDNKQVNDYFVRTSLLHYFCVGFGFVMFWYVAFTEETSILSQLGGPGKRLVFLRENYLFQLRLGFFLAVLVHIVEALYAVRVATQLKLNQETTQKWVIQTALLGYSSLRHLLAYRDEQLEQKKK